MRTFPDIEYTKDLYLDLYLPDSDSFDLFVYFHGGGLTAGNRKGAEVFAKDLTKQNIAVASVEYRLYPEAKFPDFIIDAADSIRWLLDDISSYGKLGRLFVGGSSAGGYISMMLCFDERYLRAVNLKLTDIDGYIHDAGQPTSHFRVLTELGRDSRRLIVDETAPLYFVGMNEIYSPMLFVVSDDDMFARYEQTMLMIKTLNHFGHTENVFLDVQHGKHCKYVHKLDDNGESVFAMIVATFVNKIRTI